MTYSACSFEGQSGLFITAVSLTQSAQNRQIHTDRKESSGRLRLGEMRNRGVTADGREVSPWGDATF